jgi:prepilin-type N-terminal cleavage/methylation domain-containing protein
MSRSIGRTSRFPLLHRNDRSRLTDNSGRRAGPLAFTLIELLVVISIIAILIGLLFPAFRGVQEQAKKVQAKNDMAQIITAVNALYTEYGRAPIPASEASGSAGYTYGDTAQSAKHGNDWLFNVLRGIGGLGGDQLAENPRLIAFINVPIAKDYNNPKGGLGQKDGIWHDPWGTQYSIRLDSNYSNWISTNPPYQNAPTWNGTGGNVIVWSYGKDTKLGANGNGDATATGFDDVLSWQ